MDKKITEEEKKELKNELSNIKSSIGKLQKSILPDMNDDLSLTGTNIKDNNVLDKDISKNINDEVKDDDSNKNKKNTSNKKLDMILTIIIIILVIITIFVLYLFFSR